MARDWSYSNQAGSFRPPKVIFCRECKLLIDQYDHFCPWSGTVIGAKNIQYFHSFVSVLVLTMLYDAIIIIVALTTSEESSNSSSSSGSSGYGGTTTSSSGYGGMTTSTVYEETPLHDWFDPSAYIEVAASAAAYAAAAAATTINDGKKLDVKELRGAWMMRVAGFKKTLFSSPKLRQSNVSAIALRFSFLELVLVSLPDVSSLHVPPRYTLVYIPYLSVSHQVHDLNTFT